MLPVQFIVVVLLIIFSFLCPQIAVANEAAAEAKLNTPEDDKAIFNLIFENDIFGGTDSNYTNGVRLSVLSPEDQTPDWARWLADHGLPLSYDGKKRVSMAIGQNMYTPRDGTRRVPDPNDRPYAGWLYGSVGMISDNGERLDTVMLTLGVVGPDAYAEQTQHFIHRAIGDDTLNGWDHQLKDEPGFILTMERKWRALYEVDAAGLQADVTPHAAMNLGNVNTDASTGAMVRLGFDLPADYGPPRIRPSLPGSDFFVPTEELGGYLFAGVDGRAVARNIFLDGNTFRDSPSVDKYPLVGTIQAGAALTYKDTRISYTHVFMTKEFHGQENPEQFGAITVSYRF